MLSEPIPYHSALCRVLGGVTISIVLVYLEIHHSPQELDPAPQPARAGLRIPPVSLDCDQACEDLGVSRRTLHTALESLGTWWKAEQQRSSAARSGREFLTSADSFPSTTTISVRPYAIVGTRAHGRPRTLVIHRNPDRIDQILASAGIIQPHNCFNLGDTSASTSVVRGVVDVLGKALNLGPARGGIAWGWSQKRALEHSERMTRLWAERREKAAKWLKTASPEALGGVGGGSDVP